MVDQLPNQTAHEKHHTVSTAPQPSHRLFLIKDRDTKRPRMLEIGGAWELERGILEIIIDRLPYDGMPEGEQAIFHLYPIRRK